MPQVSRNHGTVAREVRPELIAPLLIAPGIPAGAETVVGIVLLILAAVMVATAAVGYCPMYAAIHASTCRMRRASAS